MNSPRTTLIAAVVVGSMIGSCLVFASSTSPFMGLEIPEVGDEGPTYAENIIEAFELIDAHDHSSGKGTKITPAGLNINQDVEFNANDATEVRTIRFDTTAVSIAGSDRRAVYQCGGELCYIDESGNITTITNNGSVNGTPGSITGMSGSASVVYSSLTDSFTFTDDSGFPALGDFSTVRIAEHVSGGKGPRLTSNAATAADYNFIFPASLPAFTSVVGLDASGNLTNTAPAGTVIGYSRSSSGAVASGSANIIYDDSIPQNSEGTEFFSLAYSPKRAGDKVRVRVSFFHALASGPNEAAIGSIFKSGTANAVASGAMLHYDLDGISELVVEYEETVASTSSVTWSFRAGATSGDIIMNGNSAGNRRLGGAFASFIEITEIAQ